MISTRGRYALRVMTELAEHAGEGYLSLKEVAGRQDISLKYIERIMPALSRNKLVEGVQGKGGGYRLTRPPEDYTVWEILSVTEGELAPVACLESGAKPCGRREYCRTIDMWGRFYDITKEFFEGITLAELAGKEGWKKSQKKSRELLR